MAQTYKFGKGTWANKKGSTLAYSDTNNAFKPLPFNFERDSIATRVNKEGLIEVVGRDIPRIDYTDSTEGVLLLEPSRTNSLLQSNQFDTTWALASSTVESGQVGVGGSTDAWKITKIGAGGHIRQTGISVVNGNVSIYAKKGNSNWIRLGTQSGNIETYFDLENGIIGNKGNLIDDANISNIGNGWYRCSFSYTGTVTGVYIYPADSNGSVANSSGDIYVQYSQAEVGSYPTSYIPTNGSTVQREADVANGSGNSEVFNSQEGILFANISALSDDQTQRALGISDGTSSNRISIVYNDGSSNALRMFVTNPSGTKSYVNNSYIITQYNKISLKWNGTSLSFWVNGFEIHTDTLTSAFTSDVLDTLDFAFFGTNTPFYGNTKEIAVYDTLTDAELETLTSYRSLSEMVTELNLNTL